MSAFVLYRDVRLSILNMLIDIKINNSQEKCFIFQGDTSLSLKEIETKPLQLGNLVSFSNLISTDTTEKFFIKITRSKYGKTNKLKFLLREIIAERLFFTVRTINEYRCSKKLAKIEIKTPKVYGAGYFLSNKDTYNGIIIYEKLNNMPTAQEFLLTSDSLQEKSRLLKNIELDYKKMRKSKLHFRDFHMNNILVNPETMDIYWIDPGLSKIW